MPTIHNGDCIEIMKQMPAASVDAIVCDPPYGLSNTDPGSVADTITKWAGGDRDHVPTGRGFMGKSWDAFVPPPAVWDECMRVLKPGGHMVVFAGSRTHDLMGLSIRLAGFEIRDSMAWLYGSGFPKSMNVGKAIDKLAGAEREVIGVHYRHGGGKETSGSMSGPLGTASELPLTAPATPEAAQWSGHGTALKPAFEPIVLARKPLAEKTVARNVLAHGTGAINVDACRIAGDMSGGTWGAKQTTSIRFHGGTEGSEYRTQQNPSGRWPANVLLDQHAAAWVDEQSGNVKGAVSNGSKAVKGMNGTETFKIHAREQKPGYGDEGGASRFFKVAESDENGALSPYFPREFDDAFLYTAKAPRRERPNVDGVQHPTVKPLAIMRWLIRLVTPPGGVVLDPFAGSGTTIEAALIEGFDPVGIEMETDYLPLIQHRIDRQAATLTA